MRLGAVLPLSDRLGTGAGPGVPADGARRLEDTGFDSIWVFDAIGRGIVLPDPLIALSVAATVTDRVELGTGILQVPLRRPVELAHRILTAHLVCEGRLLLGVGAGSTVTDYAAVGVPFEERFARFATAVPVIAGLLRGESVDTVAMEPWPAASGGPPILIGSWAGSVWVKRAATEYDGWIGSAAMTSLDVLRDGISRFRAAGGSRAVVTNIAVDLTAGDADLDPGTSFHLRCPPQEAARRLALLAELGFDDAVVVVADHGQANLAAIRALVPPQ